MMCRILCLLIVVCAVTAKQVGMRRLKRSLAQPVFRDCGNGNSIIQFKELRFTPDPIVVPGKLTLTLHAVNTRTISNMDIDVTMVRKMSIGYLSWDMSIPCVAEVGSCTYTDICQRMTEERVENLPLLKKLREGLQEAGAPSSCPIPPSTLNVQELELELPEIPATLRPISGIADGTYNVKYRLLEHRNPSVELGCLAVEATISTQVEEEEEECEGWFWC